MAETNTHRNIFVKPRGIKYSYDEVVTKARWAQDAVMKNLKKFRRQKGLSQVQLADAVGCSQGMISKIEKGEANPTLDLIEAIARSLGISPIALFPLPEYHERIIAALEALPENRRETGLAVLEAMSHSD